MFWRKRKKKIGVNRIVLSQIGPFYRHLDDTIGAGGSRVLCVVLGHNRRPLGGFHYCRETPRWLLEKKTPAEASIEVPSGKKVAQPHPGTLQPLCTGFDGH